MAGTFREIWIPRIFIASLAPAFVMLIALIFFPSSELAKCPLFVPKVAQPISSAPLSPISPNDQLSITIQGHIFHINNSNIFAQPLETRDGSRLVFLGIVFDVTSGMVFYGAPNGAYYNLTKDGVDVTRALLVSSLDPINLTDNLDDFEPKTLKDRLVQWLPFFLNKYPQLGVVEGKFFTHFKTPTKIWQDIVQLLGTVPPNSHSAQVPYTEDCIRKSDDDNSVSCSSPNHRPKILRHRGKSRCVCGVEDELFASSKSLQFTIVHFENCNDESTICWPKTYEL